MQLLNLRETASKLRLKEETLRRFCRRREIPTVRIHRGYRFIESEINNWIKDKRVPARRKN